MATLYPSLEDLKVDQAMQVTFHAVSLGPLMGLRDYPGMAKGSLSWIKVGGPWEFLIGPKARRSQGRAHWAERESRGRGSGTRAGGGDEQLQAGLFLVLSWSQRFLLRGSCRPHALGQASRVNSVAVVFGLLSPHKPFPPSILHEVLVGFGNWGLLD